MLLLPTDDPGVWYSDLLGFAIMYRHKEVSVPYVRHIFRPIQKHVLPTVRRLHP